MLHSLVIGLLLEIMRPPYSLVDKNTRELFGGTLGAPAPVSPPPNATAEDTGSSILSLQLRLPFIKKTEEL